MAKAKRKSVEQDKALTLSFTMAPLMARVAMKKAEQHYGGKDKIPPLVAKALDAWLWGCRKTRLTFSRIRRDDALDVDAAREFMEVLTACVEQTVTVGPSTKSGFHYRRNIMAKWLAIDPITAIGSLEDT